MKQIKIIMCLMFVFTILISFNNVYGTDMLNTIIGSGTGWLGNATDEDSIGQDISDYIKNNLVDLIENIGNFVFFVVAAFLGVKYIWSGVSGKSEVKETLPTFIVGATFFYSSQLIYDFLTGEFNVLFSSSNFQDISGRLWSTIVVIVQIISIAGIIAVGLKYMLAPADKKADIKRDLTSLLIGLIMVFSLSSVMTFIADLGHGLF